MRLLITTDTVGGVWSYTRELVEGLLREGSSILLVALGREMSSSQIAWAAAMSRAYPERLRLAAASYKLEWMEDPWPDVRASREYVASLLSDYRPDLLHTNQFSFASLDTPIPKLLVAHSDVISWWQAVHGASPPSSAWLDRYRETVCEGIQKATCVVAPTQWMLDQILANYGAPARSKVIFNGCSDPHVPSTQPRHLRAVSLGRLWDEGKNIAILRDLQAEMPILIAGDMRPPGSNSDAHEKPAPAGDSVEYLGVLNKTETDALLQTSAIYIATSRYEPFGLAPVEAALAGCAIVANDIPPLREVWGEAAVYYQRNDHGSLRAKLSAMAADPALLGQFAVKAGHRARSRYLSSQMTSAYLQLYGTLSPATPFAYA